jgi:hypothetical protein
MRRAADKLKLADSGAAKMQEMQSKSADYTNNPTRLQKQKPKLLKSNE